MSGARRGVDRLVDVLLCVFLTALAVAEAGTVLLALRWLDPTRVPLWVWAAWVGRTPLYAGAALATARRDPRATRWIVAVAVVLLAVALSPLGALDPEDGGRTQVALILLLGAGWRARRARALPPPAAPSPLA